MTFTELNPLSNYMPIADDVLATQEPDSAWIMARVELIDQQVFEQGHDGAYTRALERLAIQLRDELAIATAMLKSGNASTTPHTPRTGSGCACRHKGQAYCEKHDS